jgi:hypothetical protein
MMSPATKGIVGLAWLGVAAHVVVSLVWSGGSAQPTAEAMVVGVVMFVLTLLFCVVMPERRVLLEQPCLFVPTGCALGSQALIGAPYWAMIATGEAWWGHLATGTALTDAFCAQLAGSLLVWTLHAAWLTPMIVRVVRGERAADVLVPSLRGAPALLWRTFGLLVFACAPLLLFVPFLAPGASAHAVIAMMLVLFVATPLWNGLTATLLLRALDPVRKDWLGVASAMVLSWRQRRGWQGVLFAQLTLLGFVVILPSQIKVQMLWFGSYEADNRWYAVAARDGRGWPGFGALLELAGIVLAIAIKLRIARCIETARAPGASLAHPLAVADRR